MRTGRKTLLTAVMAGGVGAATLTGTPAAPAAPTAVEAVADKPNVVLIVTEDQRTQTESATRTPQLWNRIRRHGTRFTNAISAAPLCAPSRASLLTGRSAHSHRIYSNGLPDGGWRLFESRGLDKATVATALQQEGYRTGLFGKYINSFSGAAPADYSPPGWDTFLSYLDPGGHYFDFTLYDGTSYGSGPEDHATDVLSRRTAQWIQETPSDTPLFALLTTPSAHRPWTPAAQDVGTWHGRLPSYHPASVTEDVSDKPRWVRTYGKRRQSTIDNGLASAQETLNGVDRGVARITDALAETGRLSNTLIIVTSDHGLMMGEHHLFAWKNVPYRRSVEIPLLIRWDGHTPPGSNDGRFALPQDLTTTIVKAAGATLDTDGHDLFGPTRRPGVLLEADQWYRQDSLPKHPAYCGWRGKRYMFAHYTDGTEELYDYAKDPQELTNVAHKKSYRDVLVKLRKRTRAACKPAPPSFHW